MQYLLCKNYKHDDSFQTRSAVRTVRAQDISSNKHDDHYRSLSERKNSRIGEEQACLQDCVLPKDLGAPQEEVRPIYLEGSNSSVKQNDQSKRSKDVIVVEDDDKPAAKMTEQAGESCHDRVKRSRWRGI